MNKRLEHIYKEDIADRNNKIPIEQLDQNDFKRISIVEKILRYNQNLNAQDYHRAALIFQHGHSLHHFKKAYELAIKAVELGDNSARWLVAASIDRSLLTEGKPQKYGTQFRLNTNNEWELALPIDSTITDEERAKWNVPPLKDALKVYKQKYKL